jgi:hypothetical protein
MKRGIARAGSIAALVFLLGATACSGDDGGGDAAETSVAEETATQAENSPAADEEPEPELTFVAPDGSESVAAPAESASGATSQSAAASQSTTASASATAPVSKGRVYAFIKSIDLATRKVTYDQADFLTGEAAKKAQKAAKVEEVLDYYVRNVNPRLRTAVVAPDVVALGSIVLTQKVEPSPVTLEQIAALAAKEKPSSTGFWLTIDGKGQVTKIEEQYLP